MDAGTSREGRLLGEASRIDVRSLDWSLERMSALYRHAPGWRIEERGNPQMPGWISRPQAPAKKRDATITSGQSGGLAQALAHASSAKERGAVIIRAQTY
jgi:hypothetical protein